LQAHRLFVVIQSNTCSDGLDFQNYFTGEIKKKLQQSDHCRLYSIPLGVIGYCRHSVVCLSVCL